MHKRCKYCGDLEEVKRSTRTLLGGAHHLPPRRVADAGCIGFGSEGQANNVALNVIDFLDEQSKQTTTK